MAKNITGETSILLDLIRGASAQFVLIGHLLSYFNIQETYKMPVIQNFGVLVFFILSGFLITQTTLIKGDSYKFNSYLIDRFSRIFYSFIPALLFVVVVDMIIIQKGAYNPSFNNSVWNFFGNFLMLQGYPMIGEINLEAYGSARPFWTVSVEWWIYIFFGFLYYFRNKLKPNFWHICLFIVSVPVAFLYINERGSGLSLVWAIGFALAVIYNNLSVKINGKIFWMLAIVSVLGIGYRAYLYRGMYDLGIALFFAVIILICLYPPESLSRLIKSPFFSKISKFLASFSYSLYLIHYTLIELCLTFIKEKNTINFFLILAICNIIAFGFYLLFEKNHYRLNKLLKQLIKDS